MIKKMKVIELKGHLTAMGLDATGVKAVLASRLLDAVSSANPAESVADESDSKVKKILRRRVVTHIVDSTSFDVVEYEVQWDYPDDTDPTKDEVTWEVEGNLTNALEAVHDFFSSQPKQPGCEFGNLLGVCRCALPLIHTGQDESIFEAYQKSAYQWVVQGVRGLRKKTDGPGALCRER